MLEYGGLTFLLIFSFFCFFKLNEIIDYRGKINEISLKQKESFIKEEKNKIALFPDIQSVFSFLSQKAGFQNMLIENMMKTSESMSSNYKKIVLEIKITGKYLNFIDFLKQVDNSKKTIIIKKIYIKENKVRTGVSAQLFMEAYILR